MSLRQWCVYPCIVSRGLHFSITSHIDVHSNPLCCSLLHIDAHPNALFCILTRTHCCTLLHFVALATCSGVEGEVSEWGRPQQPPSHLPHLITLQPPRHRHRHCHCLPHRSQTSDLSLVVARIPISRLRNPQIISVSWADNKLLKYFQAVNFAHIFLPPWFWPFPQNIPSHCSCHCWSLLFNIFSGHQG